MCVCVYMYICILMCIYERERESERESERAVDVLRTRANMCMYMLVPREIKWQNVLWSLCQRWRAFLRNPLFGHPGRMASQADPSPVCTVPLARFLDHGCPAGSTPVA